MIVRDKPSVFRLFFVMRGSVVPRILPKILFITLLGAAVAAAQQHYPGYFPNSTLLPFAYMLLVQRTAYLYCLMLPFFLVTSQGLLTTFFVPSSPIHFLAWMR